MKYNAVFKDGMPFELYRMKEEDRLKLDFVVDGNGWITSRKRMKWLPVYIWWLMLAIGLVASLKAFGAEYFFKREL